MAGRLVADAPGQPFGDRSPHVADALRDAHLVLAEDSRQTGRLLAHVDVSVLKLNLHAHNERERLGDLPRAARPRPVVAVVSDLGTPGVSEPGTAWQRFRRWRLSVSVVPSRNAVLTARFQAAPRRMCGPQSGSCSTSGATALSSHPLPCNGSTGECIW